MAATPPPPLVPTGPLPVRVIVRTVLVIVCVVLALYLVYQLRQPLAWIFIAGFLAIALGGPVAWLGRRMRKGFAVALVYLTLILVPFAIGALLVPPIVEQVNLLIQNVPQYAQDLTEFVESNERLRQLEEDYNITAELQAQAATLPARAGDAASILSDIGLGLVNSIFAGVTILVLSLFMIGSGRTWLDWMAERQGPDRAEWLERLYNRIGQAVTNYVAGALGQAVIAGLLAWMVLLILGVPYAGSLAVIIFLLDLVRWSARPWARSSWGSSRCSTTSPRSRSSGSSGRSSTSRSRTTSSSRASRPRALQVHPFVVLVSVLFGSALFGVVGALIAIPIAAAIEISIREYDQFRRQSAAEALVVKPDVGRPPAPQPPPAT